jgi:hypothetical protein
MKIIIIFSKLIVIDQISYFVNIWDLIQFYKKYVYLLCDQIYSFNQFENLFLLTKNM